MNSPRAGNYRKDFSSRSRSKALLWPMACRILSQGEEQMVRNGESLMVVRRSEVISRTARVTPGETDVSELSDRAFAVELRPAAIASAKPLWENRGKLMCTYKHKQAFFMKSQRNVPFQLID